ncbi:MAG: indole-3-glycerol phosphate synthase TrpC [Alphaproteobacteria bacterium]|nr:indole-3-glycerol phosphate synthase TrpC [Alphaproteobacteria bacterium]
MADILKKICDERRESVAVAKILRPLSALEIQVRAASPIRNFEQALQQKNKSGQFGVIAEMKRASPSAGVLCPHYSPPDLARAYEAAGAACLSVLTEPNHFQGDLSHVGLARAACSLPILRKDFMVDVYQVAEARAAGADAILIILAAVDDALARDLHAAAGHYGLTTVLEVHDEEDLTRALMLPTGMIGINNRNLRNLVTDLSTSLRLAPRVPQGRLMVGESGLKTKDDLATLQRAGINNFLIGESLLRQGDAGAALKALLGP